MPPTLSVTTVPTTVPGGQPIFTDDFQTASGGWATAMGNSDATDVCDAATCESFSVAYEAGGLAFRVQAGGKATLAAYSGSTPRDANLRLDVDATLHGDDTFAVLYCYRGPLPAPVSAVRGAPGARLGAAGFVVTVGKDQVRIADASSLNRIPIPPDRRLHAGVNHLTLACTGTPGKAGRVRVLIDGNLVVDVSVLQMPLPRHHRRHVVRRTGGRRSRHHLRQFANRSGARLSARFGGAQQHCLTVVRRAKR